jgi:hypothetical protein
MKSAHATTSLAAVDALFAQMGTQADDLGM